MLIFNLHWKPKEAGFSYQFNSRVSNGIAELAHENECQSAKANVLSWTSFCLAATGRSRLYFGKVFPVQIPFPSLDNPTQDNPFTGAPGSLPPDTTKLIAKIKDDDLGLPLL